MSSIRYALEKLDMAVGKLDVSVTSVENALQEYVPADQAMQQAPQLRDEAGNVIDVDFVTKRLDSAIDAVEEILREEG